MKLSLTDCVVLGLVIMIAVLAANLASLKIAAQQIQSQAGSSPLGKLLGIAP